MALISFTTATQGATANASDINTPLTTIYNDYNGNVTAANMAANTLTVGTLATAINPETRFNEYGFDFVASGCVWSGDAYASTRAASMTSGVVYVGGRRTPVSAVTSRTFTASKDTYIDVDNTGTITYTEVTNNTASPSLAAGNVRLGIIITGATTIAAATSVNQGQEDRGLPTASSVAYSVTDSLGNLICPRDPNRRILGYRQILSSYSTATTTITQITGLTCPVIVPTGRKIRITAFSVGLYSSGALQTISMGIYDGTIGGGGTVIQEAQISQPSANAPIFVHVARTITPTSASKTYNAGLLFASGTGNVQGTSSDPAYIQVELV